MFKCMNSLRTVKSIQHKLVLNQETEQKMLISSHYNLLLTSLFVLFCTDTPKRGRRNQNSFTVHLTYLKFIYSEKATKICEISAVNLTGTPQDKSKVEILQKFVAFSEYMNFIKHAGTLNYFGLFFHPPHLTFFSIYLSVPFRMCIPCMLNRYTHLLDR